MTVCEIMGTIVSVDGEKKTIEVDIGIPVVIPGHVFGQPRPHTITLQVNDMNQLREAGKLLYEKALIVGTRRNTGEAVQVTIAKFERTSCPPK